MRVLVCDDEPLARLRLRRMLEKIDGIACVGEAAHGGELLDKAASLTPDVVISDIRMPGMDGIEAASALATLPTPPVLIFCTAYDSHALEAFRVHALQYLLKPVKQQELEQALQQARRLLPAAGRRDMITARTHRGVEVVHVDDIRYFMADHKYVTVRTAQAQVLIDDALKDLEKEYTGMFVRIHRNCLINIRHLDALEQHRGQMLVRMTGIDERLPVSRRLLPSLRRVLRQGGEP